MKIQHLLSGSLLAYLVWTSIAAGQELDKPAPKAEFEVTAIRNIVYYDGEDADPAKHKLDLYLPKDLKEFPVVFFIHGGAWSSGDRNQYSGVGRVFAKHGIGSVVISYRLSPKVQHPAHIEDVARAFAWTFKNIGAYGGRADQIFVTGQSAGGHLAALLATDETYLKAHHLSIKNIKAAMPVSGVYMIPPRFMERVMGKDAEIARNASPLLHVSGREPPFLILYADNDFPGCDKMSIALNEALRNNKTETSCVAIKDRNHITIMLWLMLFDTDPATVAMRDFILKQTTTVESEKKVDPQGKSSE